MDAIKALFQILVVVFIVSTMLLSGLRTRLAPLVSILRNAWLLVLVLVVNIALVPVIGWGIAALFSLSASGYVALVLIASSPGAPFGAKLAMIQKGDVVAGASLQVLLAAIGSITFPLVANWILTEANVGGNLSLPVGQLVAAVAFLQLIPFAIGLALRQWSPATADEWLPTVTKISNIAFPLVLAGALLGSWKQLVDLIGSLTLLAAIVFTILAFVAGAVLAPGDGTTRTTVGLIAPMRNGGPVFAAVGIAFANQPEVLAAVTGILLMGLVVGVPIAAYLGKRRSAVPAARPTAEQEARAAAPPTVASAAREEVG